MATISKVNGKWRVQIRRKGITKSAYFRTKAEAQAWAIETEAKIVAGNYYNQIPKITFADLLDKYIKEVSIKKRSYREERLAKDNGAYKGYSSFFVHKADLS